MIERNYGIDLLRIVSMYMILLLHLVNHGGAIDNAEFLSGKFCVSWLFSIICYCSVNCFAAISGYVGVESDFRWRRLFCLWLTVIFYTLLITCLFSIVIPDVVSFKQWVSALAPFSTDQYWYITAYFGMFLFIPLMNNALNSMSRRAMFYFLVSVFVIICILPNVTHNMNSSLGLKNGYSTMWLIIMYLVGGIVKKLNLGARGQNSYLIAMFVFSTLAVFATKVIFDGISLKYTGEAHGGGTFIDYTSPFILFNSIALLCLFSKIKVASVRCIKFVHYFSSTALGVYLIHVHPLVWDNLLYKSTVAIGEMHPIFMAFALILLAFCIYCVCHIVDRIRQFLFTLLSIPALCERLENIWMHILSKCCSLIEFSDNE